MTSKTEAQLAASPRRDFLKLCAGAGVAASGLGALSARAANAGPGSRSRHMLIIDSLGDISDPNLPDQEQKGPERGVNARALADARASGLNAVNLTIGYVFGKEDPFEHSVRDIGLWDALIRRKSASLMRVLTAADVRQAQTTCRIGVIYGFQNALQVGESPSGSTTFADLGVRVIQLTYNPATHWVTARWSRRTSGLTLLGREVVERLNANG